MLGSLFEEGSSDEESYDYADIALNYQLPPRVGMGGHRALGALHSTTNTQTRFTHTKPVNARAVVSRPPEPRTAANSYVGLLNQGATCYLNSLLQALYMTPEFREAIYQLSPSDLGLSLDETGIPIQTTVSKSEEKEKKEALESKVKTLAKELEGMGFPRNRSMAALRLFSNLRDAEAIEKAVEWLFNNEDNYSFGEDELVALDDDEASQSLEKQKPKVRKILVELQRLFSRLQEENSSAVSTSELTQSFGWSSSVSLQQHDVHELSRVLFDAIEISSKGTPIQTLINNLYRGTTLDRISCKACKSKSERVDEFKDIGLVVRPSIIHSLREYVQKELLTGDNMYYCSVCEGKREAEKGIIFKELPQILILSLIRFEYDFENDQRRKNCDSMHFPLEVDMSPYCDEGCGDEGTIRNVEYEKLDEPKVDSNSSNLYELFAVVIHRGKTALHGHYHAYIRDLYQQHHNEHDSATSRWFDFDDSTVTPIEESKLMKQFGGTNECAYMLIYKKKTRSNIKEVELPRVVEHMRKEIEKKNREMEEQRKEYDRYRNEIEVIVYPAQSFDLIGGTLHLKPTDEEQTNPSYYPLVVDKRSPILFLKDAIFQLISDQIPSFEMLELAKLKKARFNKEGYGIEKVICKADDPALVTIEEATITDGSMILAWDGLLINGTQWDFNSILTSFTVKHFMKEGDETDVKEHHLQVPEQTLLRELKQHIHSITDIPIQNQLLCKWTYRSLTPLKESDDDKTLLQLELLEESILSVEDFVPPPPEEVTQTATGGDSKQPPPPPPAPKSRIDMLRSGVHYSTLTFKKFQERLSQLEVFVTDEYTGVKPHRLFTFHFSKETNLRTIKQSIMKQLISSSSSLDSEMDLACLKKSGIGAGSDAVLDESLSLKDAGIQDSQRLIIQRVDSLDGASHFGIALRFHFGEVVSTKTDTLLLTEVQRSSTVAQIKEAMLKLIMETVEGGTELIGWIDGQSSAKDYRLRKTDWAMDAAAIIVDEESPLYSLHILNGDLLWLERGSVPQKGQLTLEIALFLGRREGDNPVFASPNVRALASLYTRSTPCSSAFISELDEQKGFTAHYRLVAQIITNCNILLYDVKKMICEQPEFSHLNPKRIRVWYKERLLKKDKCTLKKQHLTSDAVLTIQLLEEESQEEEEEKVLLYLGLRVPSAKTFLPPQEMFFLGETHRELKESISHQMEIPVESLSIAKYLAYNNTWKSLDDDEGENANESVSDQTTKVQNDAKKKPSIQRLFNRLHIRDGDFIAVRDLRDEENLIDDFVMESIFAQKTSSGRLLEPESSIERQPTKRIRPKEVGLTIQIDDF